ncbi:MAG: DUF3025 domain-containing protein [Burkholderiales bacterium]|nr:DUF3025 domain-containing protein [Burkholderiales bacterium]
MAHGLELIGWDAPWLTGYRDIGVPLAQQIQAGGSCAEVLDGAGAAVRFVPQTELPTGMAYEQFIFERQRVPTRDGLHDFFNGLAWLHFPQTKRRLNRLQAAQIAADGVQPVRGPLRDALTVFDENAALLQAPDALWAALVARDWQQLFIGLRPLWTQASLTLFGHALLEKLVQPRKAITAHVYPVPQGLAPAALDAWLAQDLHGERLAGKPFVPLPVLGVPGWWPEQDAAFYADARVFRPPRPG